MSTQTTSANQYNPAAYTAYNAFQPQLQSSLMAMSANPLGNSYFQNQLAQQQRQGQQIGQRNISNIAQNLRTGGGILSNSSGYTGAQIARGGIANSLMQSNAFNSSLNTALQNRNAANMAMQAYQPLQTGQTTSTSGLGTFLPQIAGMAMSALSPGLGSMMGGQGFSAGYRSPNPYGGGGGGSSMSGFGAPSFSNANQNMVNGGAYMPGPPPYQPYQ